MSLNISSVKAVLPGKNIVPKPLSIEALFHKYGIERSHADNVGRNALELFDLLVPVHGMDNKKYRKLMEIAALVHDIGVSTDLEKHHRVGRDILFKHPPSELSDQLRPVVAWTTYLHKKKAGKKKLEKLRKTSFAEFPEDLQDLTLKIASLLRLADALDYSRMESRLGDTKFGKGIIEFDINGPGAKIDVERMYKKGDLWALLFETKLEFRPKGSE